jgi:hypothetical protein
MDELGEVPDSVRMLLGRSRGVLEMFKASERTLTSGLERDPRLKGRVELLQTIPGVGPVTALTWALEIGDPKRFPSASHAVSYCGLVAGRQQSGEREYRQPLSKQRNEHLQTTLIEAAHLAQRYNPVLRAVYEKVKREVHGGAAVLVVARKLVAYLMAVDVSGKPFEVRQTAEPALSSPTGKLGESSGSSRPCGRRGRSLEIAIGNRRIDCQSSRTRDCVTGCKPVDTPIRLFRGWQDDLNSNFSAGSRYPVSKWMSDPADAWIQWPAMAGNDSRTLIERNKNTLRGTSPVGRGISISPLTNPYHGCPGVSGFAPGVCPYHRDGPNWLSGSAR